MIMTITVYIITRKEDKGRFDSIAQSTQEKPIEVVPMEWKELQELSPVDRNQFLQNNNVKLILYFVNGRDDIPRQSYNGYLRDYEQYLKLYDQHNVNCAFLLSPIARSAYAPLKTRTQKFNKLRIIYEPDPSDWQNFLTDELDPVKKKRVHLVSDNDDLRKEIEKKLEEWNLLVYPEVANETDNLHDSIEAGLRQARATIVLYCPTIQCRTGALIPEPDLIFDCGFIYAKTAGKRRGENILYVQYLKDEPPSIGAYTRKKKSISRNVVSAHQEVDWNGLKQELVKMGCDLT
jgi:hypothetical protein